MFVIFTLSCLEFGDSGELGTWRGTDGDAAVLYRELAHLLESRGRLGERERQRESFSDAGLESVPSLLSCGAMRASAEDRDMDRRYSGESSIGLSSSNTLSEPTPAFPFPSSCSSCPFSFSGSVLESDMDSWCVDSLLMEMGLDAAECTEVMPDMLIYSAKVCLCLFGDPRVPV